MEGYLPDVGFTFAVFASIVTTLDIGLEVVPLGFPGPEINVSSVDGPYIVDLVLNDYYTFAFLDDDLHPSGVYSHLDFDGPPTAFAPPNSDFGMDTDADARFN